MNARIVLVLGVAIAACTSSVVSSNGGIGGAGGGGSVPASASIATAGSGAGGAGGASGTASSTSGLAGADPGRVLGVRSQYRSDDGPGVHATAMAAGV